MWRLLVLGNLGRSSMYWDACQDYTQRIQRYRTFEVTELKPQRGERTTALKKEAQLIQNQLTSEPVVLLDEQGSTFTTLQFARWLDPRPNLTFIMGSAWGIHPDLKARADFTLGLSAFTLPHELARVVLLEQVYRGLTILAGHPYHHE